MRFSWEEYWRGLPSPPPRDLPDPGIKPTSLISPALAGGFFTTSHLGSLNQLYFNKINFKNNKEKELPGGTQGQGWSLSRTRTWPRCRHRHLCPKCLPPFLVSISGPQYLCQASAILSPFPLFSSALSFQNSENSFWWCEALFQCHKPTFLFGARARFFSDFSLSQQQRLAICSQGDGVLLGLLPAGLEQRMIYFKAHSLKILAKLLMN